MATIVAEQDSQGVFGVPSPGAVDAQDAQSGGHDVEASAEAAPSRRDDAGTSLGGRRRLTAQCIADAAAAISPSTKYYMDVLWASPVGQAVLNQGPQQFSWHVAGMAVGQWSEANVFKDLSRITWSEIHPLETSRFRFRERSSPSTNPRRAATL